MRIASCLYWQPKAGVKSVLGLVPLVNPNPGSALILPIRASLAGRAFCIICSQILNFIRLQGMGVIRTSKNILMLSNAASCCGVVAPPKLVKMGENVFEIWNEPAALSNVQRSRK